MARGKLYRATVLILAWPLAAAIAFTVLLWAIASVAAASISRRLLAPARRGEPR